jgi:hypothetical protein
MAIISIPSSIGGVAIPGGLLAVGPLAQLFGNKTFASYQYPRDMGSATRGHYILFSINEVAEAQLKEVADDFAALGEAKDAEEAKALFAKIPAKIGEQVNTNLDSNRTVTTKAIIGLYMPETMAFTYNSSYDDINLVSVGQEVAGAFGTLKGGKGTLGKIKSAVGAVGKGFNKAISVAGSQTARLALQTQGLAINPQKQLLFSGIGFRDYQLVFTFTPYSKKESEDIAEIIKQFKKAAAPTITNSAGGMFFKVPASFKLQFMFNGKENTKISKVAESVLTTVDVNYSPNTWAAMDDGAPAQVMLTLNFKEIELIDSKKIGNARKDGPDGGGY